MQPINLIGCKVDCGGLDVEDISDAIRNGNLTLLDVEIHINGASVIIKSIQETTP